MQTFRLIYKGITYNNTFQQWETCFQAVNEAQARLQTETFFALLAGHHFAPQLLYYHWTDREIVGEVLSPENQTRTVVYVGRLYLEAEYQELRERLEKRLAKSKNDIDSDLTAQLMNLSESKTL